MKKLIFLFTAMIFGTTGVFATDLTENKLTTSYTFNDNAFIFVEGGITFAIYPDGEFDFYIDSYVSGRRNGITFNSGYDYSPYAQYDDYGAVIQVENIPIYYDYYGRVNLIGEVDINYRNGRVRRLGGMNVFYNNRGFYDYHTGFINIYNRNYAYNPFHRWFVRPSVNLCLVFNRPYRRYYTPIRYTYYNPYRYNVRNTYAKIGKEYRYNKVRNERATIYRNDKRVTVRDNGLRSNRTVATNSTTRRSSNNTATRPSTVKRSTTTVTRGNANRSGSTKGEVTSIRRSTNNVKQGRTTTSTKVTKTPRSTTVTRSTSTNRKPASNNTTGRTKPTVAQRSTQRSVGTRSSGQNSSSSRSTVVKRTTARSVAKAPSRNVSSRSSSTTTRSSRRQ